MTKSKVFATLISVTALGFGASAQANSTQTLPIDKPTTVNNIGLECTGVGLGDRDRVKLKDYSVRLEAVGGYGQYLADENVTLRTRKGGDLVNVKCDAPWLMIKLEPGRYGATVDVPGVLPKDIWFAASDHGLRNVYVRFSGKMAGREDHMMQRTSAGNGHGPNKQS